MASKEWREKNAEKLREYRREYYYRNRDREKSRIRVTNKRRRQALRKWFNDVKSKYSCPCGENHPACIDFHHRDPKLKKITLANAVRMEWSKEKILEEIEKCDPLCSNCHRKLHYEDFINGINVYRGMPRRC